MDSARDAEYRLRLARGFLTEAEEARGITPWELFREPEARRAIELARQAVSLAEEIAR